MKTKKDLAKYLANYLSTGIDRLHKKGLPMDFTERGLKSVIEQGLGIFELREQVQIKIKEEIG